MDHGSFTYGYGFVAPMAAAARMAAAAAASSEGDGGVTPLRMDGGGGVGGTEGGGAGGNSAAGDLSYGYSHQILQSTNTETDPIPQGKFLLVS